MGDREARVLGAGETIDVGDKKYTLSPLKLRELHELQREAFSYYKRQYLQTYYDNLDLLPAEQRGQLIERKLEEVARWDISNLPTKRAYSVAHINVTPELEKFLLDRFAGLLQGVDKTNQADYEATLLTVLVTNLDKEDIDAKQVHELTGQWPIVQSIPYDSWWVTSVYQGITAFIWHSVSQRHKEVKHSDVTGWPLLTQMRAMKMVENITAPAVGNM